jgi:hypothetical protein
MYAQGERLTSEHSPLLPRLHSQRRQLGYGHSLLEVSLARSSSVQGEENRYAHITRLSKGRWLPPIPLKTYMLIS